MNRDELLDKLAMELDKWPEEPRNIGDFIFKWLVSIDFSGDKGIPCAAYVAYDARNTDDSPIREKDWLQRRQELINCPPDSEAPEWAEWKAQGDDCVWYWCASKPLITDNGIITKDHVESSNYKGEALCGHDCRTTLTRINRDDNTSTPEEEEEFERIQARQDADKAYEADARMLDAQLHEAVNSVNVSGTKHLISTGYSDAQLEHDIRAFREVYKIAEDECEQAYGKPNANSILNAAAQHMQDRAATYDKPEGERSMAATVAAFRATTGIELTEEQGWHFMTLLKLVRSQQGDYRADSYEDGVAYLALAGEAAAKRRAK